MPGFLAEVLTWPKNYSYTIAVQTALGLNLPPTLFLDNRTVADGWSRADKKLAMAFTILQKETCRECGQPLWICRSSERDLMFSVRTDICYATAELEKFGKTKRGQSLKPGERPYIVAKMRKDDQSLPSRKRYLKELAED